MWTWERMSSQSFECADFEDSFMISRRHIFKIDEELSLYSESLMMKFSVHLVKFFPIWGMILTIGAESSSGRGYFGTRLLSKLSFVSVWSDVLMWQKSFIRSKFKTMILPISVKLMLNLYSLSGGRYIAVLWHMLYSVSFITALPSVL